MRRLVVGLTGLSLMLLAQVAQATIVVKTDASGNPASCGENNGGNILNIGTPNAAVSVGDVLVLVIIGIGFNNSNYVLTSVSTASGVSAWASAPAVSAIWDYNGGRNYVEIAKVTKAFTNGVGFTVTSSSGNTFVGGCMMDVGGLTGAFDQQTGVVSPASPTGANITPTLYNNLASEFALAFSSCEYTLNPTTPINSPWKSIGYNGVGGCAAGYLITSSRGARRAVLNQSQPGTAALGAVLLK